MTASIPAPPTMRSRPTLAMAGIGLVALAGLLIRTIVLLPAPGFVGDIDQFVVWAAHIARDGLPNAYDQQLSFGPVMVYVWGLLGFLHPALASAIDSSDPAVRILMKLPAVAADLVIAGAMWFALRGNPRVAFVAVGAAFLHPAIWFVSAWWGQYDSIYAAAGVVAFVLAIRGRDAWAVVALTVALMTKPQAAPLVIPFAAWFFARAGGGAGGLGAIGKLVRLALVGLATLAILWLPFASTGGPLRYLEGLGRYQDEFYGVASVNAWNLWWLLQEVAAGGAFVLDTAPLVGGMSYRVAGYLLTGAALLVVAYGVSRRPTPRSLAIGLAASALVAFAFLTTMHERYAFAAVPMLLFVIDDRRVRWLAALFGVAFFLNLLAASSDYLGALVPIHGPVGIVASLVNVACALLLVLETVRAPGPDAALAVSAGAPAFDEAARPSTSAGSAGATSGA